MRENISKLCKKRKRWLAHFEFPSAYRTSSQLDRVIRLMERHAINSQACLLTAGRQVFHANLFSTSKNFRALALLYNFSPSCPAIADRADGLSSPAARYESHQIVGDTVYIDFRHRGGCLRLQDGELSGFVIAGANRVFYPADVAITPSGRLLLWSDEVKAPEAVRYGWAQKPFLSLFNAEGLPAPPFRTDEWPEKSRYR